MSRGGNDEPVTVFLGDLSRDASKEEVEKAFASFGKLKSVWLSRGASGFGFIEFEDYHDASDAVKALDGQMLCGSRIRVEFSHGRGRSDRSGRSRRDSGSRSPRSRKPFSPHDVCYECGDRGHYAYDCEIRLRRQRRLRSTSRSRSLKRSTNGHSSKHDDNRRRKRSHSRSENPRRSSNGHSSRRAARDRHRHRSRSSRSGSGRDRSSSRSRSRSSSSSGSDKSPRSKGKRSNSPNKSRS